MKYERIRELREDKDLTQKQLADALYMQLTQYRRYETGEREPSLETAVAIARFYNVSVDYIAGIRELEQEIEKGYLTQEEKFLIAGFRRLSDINKGRLLERLDNLSAK